MLFVYILGAMLLWLIIGCLIYGGYYLLRAMMIIQERYIFSFSFAMHIGELILIGALLFGTIFYIFKGVIWGKSDGEK